MKNIIKVSLIITALLIIVFLFNIKNIKRYYFLKTTNFSTGSGAIFSSPMPELISEGVAISELQKNLPYEADSFAITKFDYKTARFVVEFREKKETNEKEFFDWLKSSKFSPVPEKRFRIDDL